MNSKEPVATDHQMQVIPSRALALHSNLASVVARISATSPTKPIRLVAVSKLHPANDILALHLPAPSPTPSSNSLHSPPSSANNNSSSNTSTTNPSPAAPHQQTHLHFGENYIQELLTKASFLPRSIRWHFIGGLQSNKCKQLASEVPNLWAVESVDSVKKANELDKGRKLLLERERNPPSSSTNNNDDTTTHSPLRVFIQINTSAEPTKSGLAPGAPTLDLCNHILHSCPHLKLQGLMTIGAIARSQAVASSSEGKVENEDFITLRNVRDEVVRELKLENNGGGGGGLELSMGMSDDFESAVRCGSDEVRVGSTIFGARPPKGENRIVEGGGEGEGEGK